jgi:hypothetical protein
MRIKQRLGFEHRMTISGKPIQFSDGRTYQPMVNGEWRRISQMKPWGNKAEHKRNLKARREFREYQSANDAIEQLK